MVTPAGKRLFGILSNTHSLPAIEAVYVQQEKGAEGYHAALRAIDVTAYPFWANALLYKHLCETMSTYRIFLSSYNKHIHVDDAGRQKGFEVLYSKNGEPAFPMNDQGVPGSLKYESRKHSIKIQSTLGYPLSSIAYMLYDPLDDAPESYRKLNYSVFGTNAATIRKIKADKGFASSLGSKVAGAAKEAAKDAKKAISGGFTGLFLILAFGVAVILTLGGKK